MRSCSAAVRSASASFHRIEAQPRGEITEYTECSSMRMRSVTPIASAPPEPPSPITIEIVGTLRPAIFSRQVAIASAWPRSSASTPGNAPAVSTSEITGMSKRSASSISRIALR